VGLLGKSKKRKNGAVLVPLLKERQRIKDKPGAKLLGALLRLRLQARMNKNDTTSKIKTPFCLLKSLGGLR
jgi:hypothetical protein